MPMLNSLTECDCVKATTPETKRDPTADAMIDLIRRFSGRMS